MRGRVPLFFAFLAVATAVAASGQPDVGKASWGMTPTQVKAVEAGTPTEDRDADGNLAFRYPAPKLFDGGTLAYIFVKDMLSRALFLPAVKHEGLDEFVTDFHNLSAKLERQYGEPGCDRNIWLDDSLQIERMGYLIQDRKRPSDLMASDQRIGESISLGHVRLYESWDTPRMRIIHLLTGSKGKVSHMVEFRSVQAGWPPLPLECVN